MTPHLCGMYETARELCEAECELGVKAKIVDATEESLIAVVVAHTTAASVTQISVKRKLALHIANGHYGANAAADTGESAE